jgi:hypothetical protein
MKKFAKVLHKPFSAPGDTNGNPPSKHIVSAIFRDRFVEKDGGLHTHNPSA